MSEHQIPDENDSRCTPAQELASEASVRPERITDAEMRQLVAFLRVPDVETRLEAAETLQNLCDRQTLCGSMIAKLVGCWMRIPQLSRGCPPSNR